MIGAPPPSREDQLRRYLEDRNLLPIVTRIVAAHPGVRVRDVLSRSRQRPVSDARAHCVYELYDVLGSYPAVGRALGIDHTSAIAARAKWARVVGDVRVGQHGKHAQRGAGTYRVAERRVQGAA